MKRWLGVFALALFGIFAVGDFVRDFNANEPIRYFAAQPLQLLWVAAIAIGGGLIAEGFCRLSPRLQRRVKICATGLVATFLTIFTGYFLYQIAGLFSVVGARPGPVFVLWIACGFGGAAFLWFEFYQISKSRVK
ncbi:MAG: hypothetical protein ABSF38_01200 [Verrucomicrobiota bacterium]|jgi:hypothetical protein